MDKQIDEILKTLSEASWATDMRKDLQPLQAKAKTATQNLLADAERRGRIDEVQLLRTVSGKSGSFTNTLDKRLAQLRKGKK